MLFSGVSFALPNAELSALWVTLGRAFLPPLEPDHWRALHADLPLDLADWSRNLGLVGAPQASDLLEAFSGYREHESLLVHYSGLFYAPPIRVSLNLGMYLDGGLNGPVQDRLARWHSAYGLDRHARFHDLSDHLSAVLEFLGLIESLEERQLAREFAHTYLNPALPSLIHAVEMEGALSSPYLWLLRFLGHALDLIYPSPIRVLPARVRYRERPIGDGWRRCRHCDKPVATEAELAVIEKALANAGLPTAHLSLCPECRETARGWEHRALPKAR